MQVAQNLFLAAESKLKGLSDKEKYERARRLKDNIGKVRQGYQEDMESRDAERQQLGVATYLIDKLALRVGNEKDENEADTVGCCSLRIEHITLGKFTDENGNEVGGENTVTFDFLGKDSMRYLNTVTVEPLVFQLIKMFQYKLGIDKPIKKD